MSRPRFWRLQLLLGIVLLLTLGMFAFGSGRTLDLVSGLLLRTTIASNGVIETALDGDGLMARSEVAVRAPSNGAVTLLVTDGQRVRTGQVVAEIREDLRAHTEDAIRHLDNKIVQLDRQSQSIASDYRRRLDQLQRNIDAIESEVTKALSAGRSDLANELTVHLNEARREHLALDTEFGQVRSSREAERRGLVEERAVLRASTASIIGVVRAETPGVVSFAFDDFEDALTPGQAPDDIWALFDSISGQELLVIEDGSSVTAGATLFRLIDNFTGHVFVQFTEVPPLRQGQRVWLRWNGTEPSGVSARVHSVHNRESRIGVWFSLDTYQDSFGTLRKLGRVTVITERVQGTVLPKSVIAERGGRTGLYLVAESSSVFRTVNILAADDERVVVDNVPSGSRVVTNPRWLTRTTAR